MIKTVKLASYELRRFKGPLPIVALLFLLLVPTLYGALYLWSNWDPYGKLDQVPVAVVNQDAPVTVAGKSIAAGDRLVSELQADPIFDWQFVDATQANDGLANGSYYMIITIPPEFSANLVSGASDDPTRAVVTVTRDDANGYVAGLLTVSVQNALEAAINRAAVGAYFDSVFANLATIKTDITTAAGTATQLAAGADATVKGATDVSTGIATAKNGSAQLVSGLADAKTESSALVTGTSDAKAGSASLVTGLTTLETGSGQLVSAAGDVSSGSQQLSSTIGPASNSVNAAVQPLGQASANLPVISDNLTTIANTPGIDPTVAAQIALAASQTNTAAGQVSSGSDSVQSAASDLSSASSDVTALAVGAAQVSTGADSLNTGIGTASSGASTLDSGIGQLSTDTGTLDSGIGTLQLGAQQLDDGLGVLATGSTTLVDGVTQTDTGLNQLATDITAAADRIPTVAPDQQDSSEQVLSSPADVQVTVDNPATVYGRGLAPFFFAIAIWVFAITVFLVMRPISGRALAGRARSIRISLAGWLPVVGLAALGSLLLLGIVWLGLGLNPVNVGGSIGVVVLAAACFTAITHALRTWLGVVGSAIALVLLIVQLTCAGGLYPVETLPAPFRVIHAFIPMTYLVDALRVTFTGGPTDHLWRDVGVLAGFTIAAVLLCWLVVHRKRRFRLSDLHPALG